jgi:hypothetical protein
MNAGISTLEPTIIDDLHKRDRRPLMALLLACLPNLTTVHAHAPPPDSVLGAVLENVLNVQRSGNSQPSPLASLRELYIFGEVPIPSGSSRPDEAPGADGAFRLNYFWPVLYLKGLKTLSLCGTETTATQLKGNYGPSNLEQLYLVSSKESRGAFTDIQNLLAVTKYLTRFSFVLEDRDFGPVLSNREIWDALQGNRDSLEYFDIFWQVFMLKRGLLSQFQVVDPVATGSMQEKSTDN